MISSGSTLAEDIRYGLAHWPGLTRLLDDGRFELDTHPVETAIRPICLIFSSSTIPSDLFGWREVGFCKWLRSARK